MDNEKLSQDIIKRLDVIIKLLATSSLKDSSITDRIYFLHKSGFSPTEISEILNTTSNYVNVILSNMRKKGRKNITETQESQEKNINTASLGVQNG